MDEDSKGADLRRISKVSPNQGGVILAHADICKAIRFLFPDVVPPDRNANQVMLVGEGAGGSAPAHAAVPPGGSPPDEVGAYLAATEYVIPPTDFSKKPEWTDQEVVEVLVAWKQQRDMIQDARKKRGFPPAKVAKFSLDDVRKKTRCFYWKQVGHFKKDCPKRLAKQKGTGAAECEEEKGEAECHMCNAEADDDEKSFGTP